jgi:hypothetical protein
MKYLLIFSIFLTACAPPGGIICYKAHSKIICPDEGEKRNE